MDYDFSTPDFATVNEPFLIADALKLNADVLGDRFQLSRNFLLGEVRSKDGDPMVLQHPQWISTRQIIRDLYGKPIISNSGYRSPAHNKAEGGAPQSYHIRGMADDLRPHTTDGNQFQAELQKLYDIIQSLPSRGIHIGGLKKYRNFIHVDIGRIRKF